MRYSQLRAFDAAAREASFTRAAARLGVTQPAVTVQVRALEEDYGVKLFARHGAEVALTEEGRSLLELTGAFFAAEEAIEAHLSAARDLAGGSLTLAADGPHVALDLIARFRQRHPGVRLRVVLGNARTTLEAVLSQAVDVAVLANPAGDPRLEVRELGRQDMLALFPPGHRLAGHEVISIKDLAGEAAILREPGSNTRRTLERALRKARVSLGETLELGSREAMREAVAAGLGVGFLFDREMAGETRVAAAPLEELRGSSRDCLVCLKSQAGRRSVAALLALAPPAMAGLR